MLMKEFQEKDPLVQQTIHENVSFIKIEEGYPCFMNDMEGKEHNTMKLSRNSQSVGILDFYESLSIISKFWVVMRTGFRELMDTHKPESGLMAGLLEVSFVKNAQA